MVTQVHFVGGPRNGEVEEFPDAPREIVVPVLKRRAANRFGDLTDREPYLKHIYRRRGGMHAEGTPVPYDHTP